MNRVELVSQEYVVTVGEIFVEPRMIHSLTGWYPLFRIILHHKLYQVFGLFADVFPFLSREGVLPLQYFIENSLISLPIERWLPRQHHIHNNPQWPNITFFVIRFLDNLWCNIVHTAYFSCVCLAFMIKSSGPKINNFYVILLIGYQHDVLGFQIPMNDFVFMAIRNSWEKLVHEIFGSLFVHFLTLGYPVEKLSSPTILHHHINKLLFLIDIDYSDNVRMILYFSKIYQLLKDIYLLKMLWDLRIQGNFFSCPLNAW